MHCGTIVRSIMTGAAVLLSCIAASAPPSTAAIGRIVAHVQTAQRIPSISVAVINRGKLTVYGDSRVYAVGSLTKSYTAAAVLELAAQKRIDVRKYLDAYVPQYRFASKIRISDLLDQTSGVPNYLADAQFIERTISGHNASPLATLNRLPLHFRPGYRYEYSNGNYYLLQLLVSKVGKAGYANFVRRSLIEPLHLHGTYVELSDVPAGRRARGFAKEGGHIVTVDPLAADPLMGTAQMWSDAASIVRWERAYFEGVFARVARRAHALQRKRLPDGNVNTYSAGWLHGNTGDADFWWHNGMTPGYSAAIIAMPAKHFYAAVLANADYANPEVAIADLIRLLCATASRPLSSC
jgi:CubicO group peptidase (beta-lactamase class C family)